MNAPRWTLVLTLCLACSSQPVDPGKKDGGGGDGGTDVPPAPFTLSSLEPNARGLRWMAMAVGPSDRVGVAYFHELSDSAFEVRYVEWAGGVAGTSELVRPMPVKRVVGIALAFQPNGQPAIAYLGGDDDGGNNLYWAETDAVLATRSAGGTWTESVLVNTGDEATAGNPVSDTGFLVGLFPALAYDSGNTYLAYRDAHNAQFGQQDYAGSDLEIVIRGGVSQNRVVVAGGNNKKGWGGHSQIVIANGQPAILADHVEMTAEGPGKDPYFVKRNADGTWTAPVQVAAVGSTQTGASFAYDSTLGFAVAVLDRTRDALLFTSSPTGVTWDSPTPVYEFGTGGWWPSVAVDPTTHDPSIVYYVCSTRGGVPEGMCRDVDDDLRIATRAVGNWRHGSVDPEGGYLPKLGILSTGQRVIAYRALANGALKLAVER